MADNERDDSDQAWIGKSIVEVCERLGQPDAVEPAQYYCAKFSHGIASVVLSYEALNKRWYLTREGIVLGVVEIKR